MKRDIPLVTKHKTAVGATALTVLTLIPTVKEYVGDVGTAAVSIYTGVGLLHKLFKRLGPS